MEGWASQELRRCQGRRLPYPLGLSKLLLLLVVPLVTSQPFTSVPCRVPHFIPCLSHFTDEDTEAQERAVIGQSPYQVPKQHSQA